VLAAATATGLVALGVGGVPQASATGLSSTTTSTNANWVAAAHGEQLGQSQTNTGDVVAFWQGFLASYNQLSCPGGIDGHYGPNTASGTKALQNFWSLTADGVVGTSTWNVAGTWLDFHPGGAYDTWTPFMSTHIVVTYANVHSNGAWKWTSPAVSDGNWHGSDTPGITFTQASAAC
jgi:Putative peptidoglycan binding domain